MTKFPIPPVSFNDLIETTTTKGGGVTYEIDNDKAAKAFLSKMTLAVEVFDSHEDQPEIWFYENGVWHSGGAHLISHFIDKVAGKYSDITHINDILRRLRGELRLQPVEFDIGKPHLISCKDGSTINLMTGKVRKSIPEDLISMPIPVKYDPSARCPQFIAFLNSITATEDDQLSIIDFLGSTLVAESMDFFAVCPGLGSNGRTILKNFIRAFLGSDACRSIPLKNLSDRFIAGFLTRTRINFCNETEIGGIILEFIKRFGEKMPVEQKFKGMVNAILFLKFFFETNIMPTIQDTSFGAERRLVRWDLPWRFVDNPNPKEPMEKQRDPNIITKITTDE